MLRATTPAFLAIMSIAGCGLQPESLEEQTISFAKNVESCVCRTMNFESDFPSGIRYSQIVDKCNATVHESNDQRYEDSHRSDPTIASLRCPEDVEPWLEIVESDGLHEQ